MARQQLLHARHILEGRRGDTPLLRDRAEQRRALVDERQVDAVRIDARRPVQVARQRLADLCLRPHYPNTLANVVWIPLERSAGASPSGGASTVNWREHFGHRTVRPRRRSGTRSDATPQPGQRTERNPLSAIP